MIELTQDIFDTINDPFTATCVTTNAIVKTFGPDAGKAVMGAGIAGLIRDKYIGCDVVLGALIRKNGSKVQQFLSNPVILLAFPTKNHYNGNSTLQLVKQSALQLKEWADNHPEILHIILPRPGADHGHLLWEQVQPILANILTEDKFIVITNE